MRGLERILLLLGLALLAMGVGALIAVWTASPAPAQPTVREMVQGTTGAAVDFVLIKRCNAGTQLGRDCTADADCPGSASAGRCETAIVQVSTLVTPSWAATRTEQRTVGTSAVDSFSVDTQPCVSVRVKNFGSTTIYAGFSGVTTATGIPILPGEYGPVMTPPSKDCRAVKLISDAAGGLAAVVTP